MHTRPDCTTLHTRVRVPQPDGTHTALHRSLGTSDLSRGASVSSALQELADSIHERNWHKTKHLVEAVFLAAGHPLPLITKEPLPVLRVIAPFVEDYLRRRAPKVSAIHHALLKRCLLSFARKHVGMELCQFKGHHIQAWLDGLGALAAGSVRNQFAAVSGLFHYAVRMGALTLNPCSGVDAPAKESLVPRAPMEDGDFQKLLAHLVVAHRDWYCCAMVGRYSGLRLVDAARLCREAVSFEGDACILSVKVGKTGERETLPVFEPLASFLRGFEGSGALAPSLAKLSSSALSKQFVRHCDEAGITAPVVTSAGGREYRTLSFHGLKHAFVTDLVKRGIPLALRLRLAAHATESAHGVYDHGNAVDLHRQVVGFFSQQKDGNLSSSPSV